MKTIDITACTTGIARAYMTGEKLVKEAKARGHECRVETQRTTDTGYKLTEQEITETGVVILAVNVKISGEERFKGEPIMHVGTAAVIKSVIGFIEKVEKVVESKG